MCAALMDLEQASTEELQKAIARKLQKFGSVAAMPKDTRALVIAGQAELANRADRP